MAKKTKNEIEAERQQLAADEAAFSAEDAGRQEDELAERVNAFAKAIDESHPNLVKSADGYALDEAPTPEQVAEAERLATAQKVSAQFNEHGQPRLRGESV